MAIAYAGRGWHVFPCKPDKKPYTEHGFHDATTDPDVILAWWTKWPQAQIGVACGASGIAVVDLDIDEDKDGIAAFGEFLGPNPHGCALIARTPRGGKHLVYSDAEHRFGIGSDVGSMIGIDVRAVGGYFIAPSGDPVREWIEGDPFDGESLPPPPDHLLPILPPAGGQKGPRQSGSMRPAGTASTRRCNEVWAALSSIPANVKRPDWLRAIWAAHAALDADEQGADMVESWSEGTEAPGQYEAGEASGIYATAVLPQNARHGRKLVDAETLFHMAYEHGWNGMYPLPSSDDSEWKFKSEPLPPGGDTKAASNGERQAEGEDDEQEGAETLRVRSWVDVVEMPSPDWQIEGWLPEQSIVVFAGPSTAGKSFVLIDIAMRMVHGMPFHGLTVKPGSVLYFAGEGFAGIGKRMRAWRIAHGRGATDVERMAHLREMSAGRECAICEGVPNLTTKEGRKQLRDVVAAMKKQIGHAPALVIVDTISTAFGDGDENDAKVVTPALRAMSRLRIKHGCSVIGAHHLTKNPPASLDQLTLASVRGSGAFVANVDVVWGILASASGVRTLKPLKLKDDESPDRFALRLESVATGRLLRNDIQEMSAVPVSTKPASDGSDEGAGSPFLVMQVLEVARSEGCSAAQIETATGLARTTVWTALNQLVDCDKAERSDARPYRYWKKGYKDSEAKFGTKFGRDSAESHTEQPTDAGCSFGSGARRAPNEQNNGTGQDSAFEQKWRAAGIAPARDIGDDMARFHAECKAAGIVTPGTAAFGEERAQEAQWLIDEAARLAKEREALRRERLHLDRRAKRVRRRGSKEAEPANQEDGLHEKPKQRRKPKSGGAA